MILIKSLLCKKIWLTIERARAPGKEGNSTIVPFARYYPWTISKPARSAELASNSDLAKQEKGLKM